MSKFFFFTTIFVTMGTRTVSWSCLSFRPDRDIIISWNWTDTWNWIDTWIWQSGLGVPCLESGLGVPCLESGLGVPCLESGLGVPCLESGLGVPCLESGLGVPCLESGLGVPCLESGLGVPYLESGLGVPCPDWVVTGSWLKLAKNPCIGKNIMEKFSFSHDSVLEWNSLGNFNNVFL